MIQIFLYSFALLLASPYQAVLSPPSDGCKRLPPFTQKMGFDVARAAFSTSEKRVKGLVYVELSNDSKKESRTYQDPSWKKFGAMGPIAIDEDGAVFVAPVPMINVLDNPTDKQNILYRVSPMSGAMSQFVNLPSFSVPNKKFLPEKNPFGLLGLTYDCDTKLIYAASVANSSPESEVGRLFVIEKTKGEVVDMLDGIDAMGIGVSDATGQKRLYVGKTRTSDIVSIGLSPDGKLNKSDIKLEASLDGLGERGDDRARKIRFSDKGEMTVRGIEFFYNLIAPTEKQETAYNFRYDAAAKQWRFYNYGQ